MADPKEMKELHFAHVVGRTEDALVYDYGCKRAKEPDALKTEDSRAFRLFGNKRCNECFTWHSAQTLGDWFK